MFESQIPESHDQGQAGPALRIADIAELPTQSPAAELTAEQTPRKEALLHELASSRLPEQMLRFAQGMQQDGSRFYRATVRLSPPALGELRIELRQEKDSLRAHFVVESATAREQVHAELPRLRELLAQQNWNDVRVEVEVRQDGNPGGQSGDRSGDGPSAPGSAPWAETSRPETSPSLGMGQHEGLLDTRA